MYQHEVQERASYNETNMPYVDEVMNRAIVNAYKEVVRRIPFIPMFREVKHHFMLNFISDLCLEIVAHDAFLTFNTFDQEDLIYKVKTGFMDQYIPEDEALFNRILELGLALEVNGRFFNAPFGRVW